MYRVVSAFYDTKNNDHLYEVGDKYPVSGSKLATDKNSFNRVFIEEVKDDNSPEPTDEVPTNDEVPEGEAE
jgi:hypothetical protein